MMDTELTPALERVAASVIETQRRRQQLEEELAAATAAIAALTKESESLESSVLTLRRELQTTLEKKAQEDAALEQLTVKRTHVVEQIDALVNDIRNYIADRDRATNALAAHMQQSNATVQAVAEEVKAVKVSFASVSSEVAILRTKVEEIRKTLDATESLITDIGTKAKDLDAASDSMAARVCRIAEAVEGAEKNKQQISGAGDQLNAIIATLQERKKQAEHAADEVSRIAREREQSAAVLEEQLKKIDELCSASQISPASSTPAVSGSTPSSAAPASTGASAPATTAPPPAATNAETPAPAPTKIPVSPPAAVVTPNAPIGASAPQNGSPVHFVATMRLLDFLAAQELISLAESQQAVQMLREGGVDKLVRSWWSRAMASISPGYYRLVLGEALVESGDPKGALTFFNRALENQKLDPFIGYLVALALLDMKRYVDVLKIAQGLGKSKHGKVLSCNVEALHLAASRHFEEAEAKLAQALTTQGQTKLHYNETLYNLARLAETKGDARAAGAWFEKLYGIDPTYRDIALHIEKQRATVLAT